MKCLVIVVLFAIAWCDGNFVCQSFDENTKQLEKYCAPFRGVLPVNCSNAIAVESTEVNVLKLVGCEPNITLNAIKSYENVRVIDISGSGYSNLDWLNIKFDNLEVLNVSHNEITNVSKLHEIVPNVYEIDLSHNKLKAINIQHLWNIMKIHLSHNNLEHLDIDSTELEYVDLSNNNFLNIPRFPNNSKLKILKLEENTIKNFTCQRIPWSRSVSVYLSWTYVERFDGSEYCDGKTVHVVGDSDDEGILATSTGEYELHCNEKSFQNVRYFRAGRNAFTNISKAIASLGKSVSHLDLSGNYVSLQDLMALKRFDNLNTVSLSDTNLLYFDFGMLIGSERQLKSLDISYNRLKSENLSNISLLKAFVNLKQLNIAGNQLKALHEVTYYVSPGVELLDLSENNVGNMYNGSFERLVKLKTLNLRNANLTFVESNPFAALANLRSLDISDNNLTHVHFGPMSEIVIKLQQFSAANTQLKDALDVIQYFGVSLQKLNLYGNRIGEITPETFQAVTNLIHLNLSHTNLAHFDLETVRHQQWLHTLDISHNKLHYINLGPLTKFHFMQRLYLNGNDLVKLDNFVPSSTPSLTIAIENNWLSCAYLKQLKYDYPHLRYIGHQLNQKHGDDCLSTSQAINEFLNTVYDKVKFW